MAYPPHKIEEKDGHREYVREEAYGNVRRLKVWSLARCREKLAEAQVKGAEQLNEMFKGLYAQLGFYGDGPDPMMAEWYRECIGNVERAYNELTGASDEPVSEELETFGYTDDLEVFGA